MILALRRKFAENLPVRLQAIRDQFARIDPANWQSDEAESLYRLVHSLIGAAGTFGMNAVSIAAREIEPILTKEITYGQPPSIEVWQKLTHALDQLGLVVQGQCLGSISEPQPNTAAFARPLNGHPLIHLIEDDELLAQNLQAALIENGFRVEIFTSLDDLRTVWNQPGEHPAAMIVDMIFPEGENAGTNLMVELGLGRQSEIPVVVVSTRDDLAARLAAFRAGASRYLTKPVDPDRLCRLLNELTGRLPPEPYRILLVDDEDILLEAYSAILRQAGMEVYAVTHAMEALEALKSFKPDVVILDMYMPDASGPELAAVLREQDLYAQTPILFLSAEADPDKQLMALNLGGDDFLLKPIQPAHLVAAVTARARRTRQNEEVTHRLQVTLYEREREHMALDRHALVSITDRTGIITYVNDNFCIVSGYSRKELIGKTHRLLKSGVHAEAHYEDLWRTVRSGKIWRGEICNRNKDGSRHWVSNTITPFLDQGGNIYQYVSICNDITQIKQAAAELERLGERLSVATEAAGVGIFDFDIANNVLDWDPRMVALYGHPDLFSGTIDAWANALHPDDAVRSRQEFADALDGKRPYNTQFRVIWPDGSVHWIQATAAIARDADGKPLRMIGTNWDVSESKEIEKQLLDSKIQAEAANRAKSDFLSSMSHELRTPMNAILGFGQMLEYDSALNEEQHDNVHEITKAGRHLLELINQVLDLAKVEAGQVNLNLAPVELDHIISDCLHLTQPLAHARNISMCIEIAPDAVVHADRTRLKQVLLNLLSNAIKYNHENGSIELSVQPGSLQRWRISVRDRGIGIAPGRIAELFQPFSRLDAENSDIQGTGIGLTITRQLVELMGGEVGVIAHEDVGATFWIEMPLAFPMNQAVPPEKNGPGEPSPASVASQYRILCIDDNASNLKLIAQALSKQKHIQLLLAQDAEMGLELAQTHELDLVLLDINMPGMSGYEVLKKLQTDQHLKTMPVIAITANAMPNDVAHGLAAGFSAYLVKPLDMPVFLQTIDRCLKTTKP
jgi:PAS domain S-box-containing protein